MATPLQTYATNYNNSQERKNSQTWQNATINDVAKKYGFNFSKDYANQQTETVAQAQRNLQNNAQRQNQSLNQQTMNQINSDLKQGIVGTENNFFQTYLQQRQNQANRGINSGMQADQDLRLGMNQQGVLADMYRDANNNKAKEMDRFNNESLKVNDSLALIEQQRITEAEKLYQDLLTKGYGMLGTERGWYNSLDQQQYGKYQDQINNWYKEQDYLMEQQRMAEERAARARAEKAARDQAAAQAAQQSAIQKQLQAYQAQLAKQAAPQLTPIQKYTYTPAQTQVDRRVATPTTSPATKYAFSNPVTNYTRSVANNSSLSAYEKMKMLFDEK